MKKDFKDLKLIIAPRHLDRVQSIIDLTGFKPGLRSQNADFSNNDIIILDTLGELSRIYSIVNIAFIGGSFNNTGGHNPLEATIYSKPVISGPSIKNFKDIYSILTKAGAASVVSNEKEFETCARRLLSDNNFYQNTVNNSKNVFEDQKGAKDFVIQKIRELF